MENTNLCEYFSRISKVETNKPNTLKYIFDRGRFECIVKIDKIDSRFSCYVMKVQTNYGYLLDKQIRLVDVKAEDAEYIVKKFFISSILNT